VAGKIEVHAPPARVRLEGGLGLANWLVRTSQALAQADETPIGMSYQVGFDVIVGGSVTPRFGIAKPSGHQYGGGLQVSGRRARFHSVTVSTTILEGTAQATQERLNNQVQQFLLQDNVIGECKLANAPAPCDCSTGACE